jgi:hypothetical protein
VQFPCKRCGAEMAWDPDARALSCAHCGAQLVVPAGERTIVELLLADSGGVARGFGIATRTASCKSCGASVSFDGQEMSRACVFCGAPAVLEAESLRNAIRPGSLIPLDVGRARVEKAFERWIAGLWFRPTALKRTRRFDALGVYVPCWTFDCAAHSVWSADAGYYYYVTETRTVMVNGRAQVQHVQVQKVRWEPAAGSRDDRYDDLPVHASRGLPAGLAEELGRFELAALVAYRPEYLAGWHAEEYAVDLESGWKQAEERIVETQRSRCSGDVPGDTQRNLRVQTRLADVRWKLVLLPVWSLTYRWKGKPYAVLVHGQSGKVVGHAPISVWKILALVLVVVVAALVIWALLASR